MTAATSLTVGERRRVKVRARKRLTWTGIAVRAGQSFEVAATGVWVDLVVPSRADGHSLGIWPFGANAQRKRLPEAPWFSLCMSIDEDPRTATSIGGHGLFAPQRDGELTCWPNDMSTMYWNNWLSLQVTLTRVS